MSATRSLVGLTFCACYPAFYLVNKVRGAREAAVARGVTYAALVLIILKERGEIHPGAALFPAGPLGRGLCSCEGPSLSPGKRECFAGLFFWNLICGCDDFF
jgi:hypothetical protein